MDLNLKNKIIVVSEGAKTISEGIIKVLANEYAVPVIIGKNENDFFKIKSEIEGAGKKCFYFVADLTKPGECENAVQQILKKFGRIDGLINNAELTGEVDLKSTTYQDFIASLDGNIVPYYLLAHYALPALKKSKGAVINVIAPNNVATNGETALTREWAVELLKYGIRVNAVVSKSDITTTEEIANTVAFLLSEKSSHTTGQLIHIDSSY